MLYKLEKSSETYLHVCEGLSKKKMLEYHTKVYLHDVSPYMHDEEGKMVRIRYCPFCGHKIGMDEEEFAK